MQNMAHPYWFCFFGGFVVGIGWAIFTIEKYYAEVLEKNCESYRSQYQEILKQNGIKLG